MEVHDSVDTTDPSRRNYASESKLETRGNLGISVRGAKFIARNFNIRKWK